ncbi:MAG: hypothetical protein H7Y13_02615 [Sphingobacteriaceae bacterium]|nr:hypothetical protein [Sphingobacteriaceae bacterium]
MKYTCFFLLITIISLNSCNEQILTDNDEDCPSLVCTEEFRSVTVKFRDASGKPVTVTNFGSVIRRTGKTPQSGVVDSINFKGSYAVVTDNDTKNLSTLGDTIDVSGVHHQTNQKKTVQFVVKGGKCACHIEKVSGPEEIVFD